MKRYLLFDLDGTLTDPKIGITTCVQYALQDFGIDEPDLDKLEPFIGPPLSDSFREFYGMDEEQAERAVEKYRERFQTTGLFENEVYDGILPMLRKLKGAGMHLAVASSKPTVFVERILEHFRMRQYFEVVVGSELDGTRVKKEEVVAEALRQLFAGKEIQYDQVYMIGDRKFDVEGAKAKGIESVGVSYGYGSLQELKQAHADYIVRTVEELERFLLRGSEERKKHSPARYLWEMVYPFLLFQLTRSLVQGLTGLALFSQTENLPAWLGKETGNPATLCVLLSFFAAGATVYRTAGYVIRRSAQDRHLEHLKKESKKNVALLLVMTAGMTLGINLLLSLTHFVETSQSYEAVAAQQFSSGIWLGILCYGLVSPIAEELLFRGILHNYGRKFFGLKSGMALSAAMFALYHGNTVQGVYGLLMGLLFAYAYEYFGTFLAPVAMHILANMIALALTYAGESVSFLMGWYACIAGLALGIGSLWLLHRQKQIL